MVRTEGRNRASGASKSGIKNIHIGPTLPAFVSPNVLKVLVENFGLGGNATVDEDLKAWGLLSPYAFVAAVVFVRAAAVRFAAVAIWLAAANCFVGDNDCLSEAFVVLSEAAIVLFWTTII